MWGTVILDTYGADSACDLQAALEELASPLDTYGFASGAIYCFWDIGSRAALYVGKAVDVPERFAQHNGMRGTTPKGNKHASIEQYLDQNNEIGFSIPARSANSQTPVGRLRNQLISEFGQIDEASMSREGDRDSEREISHAEAIAIRSHWLEHKRLPPWNQIEGDLNRWGQTMGRPDSSIQMLTGATDTLFQARRTITELASEPTSVQFESVALQLARSQAVRSGIFANEQISDFQILAALDAIADRSASADRERIRSECYLTRPFLTTVEAAPDVLALRQQWTAGEQLTEFPAAPPLRDR